MILFMRNVTLFIAALAAFVQPVMADNQVSNVPREKGKYSNNWQSLQQWDCPRASVLLIFRELQSMTFTTQTVGRILRMPEQHFYKNDILNYGYVYTCLLYTSDAADDS